MVVVVVVSKPCRAAYHTCAARSLRTSLETRPPPSPSPTPQALRLQQEWPGVLWLEWEGGEMQSEASEVTLGGKAHVGPGCVCATRHQPSCLDRGKSLSLHFLRVCHRFLFTIMMITLGGVHWSWE